MTFHSIPRNPNALFDLANEIVNGLAEKRAKFVAMDPSFGLELLTHLNAASDVASIGISPSEDRLSPLTVTEFNCSRSVPVS
ncbi:MAG: hypothetical protein DMG15_20280 [Acidobacteria bacterium]|nr:MAG: hypothetical protein DMG15_20280 [Acidobacteriota bacterium]